MPSQQLRNPEYRPTEIIKKCQEQGRPAHIAGPMVRYSKLPFRELCRFYNVDIVYTPMIFGTSLYVMKPQDILILPPMISINLLLYRLVLIMLKIS